MGNQAGHRRAFHDGPFSLASRYDYVYGRVRPRHLVDCLVSCSEVGSLEAEGRVFDVSVPGCWCPSRKDLVPAQYVQARLRLPIPEKAIAVRLAAVTWIHEARFGLEILIICLNRCRGQGALDAVSGSTALPASIHSRPSPEIGRCDGNGRSHATPALTPSIGDGLAQLGSGPLSDRSAFFSKIDPISSGHAAWHFSLSFRTNTRSRGRHGLHF